MIRSLYSLLLIAACALPLQARDIIGDIDGDYKVDVLLKHNSGRVCNFADLTLKNFNDKAIYIGYGAGFYENIHIDQEYTQDTDLPVNTIGIYDVGGDNAIVNCSIVDCKTGIVASHGTNHINCYVWLSQNYLYDLLT